MRLPNLVSMAAIAVAVASPAFAEQQSVSNLNALRLLVPFSALLNTPAGKAALASNLTVTGAIQNGTASQPLLQSFPEAQAQALKDATITSGNGWSMAEGLGSKLGGAYQSLTSVGAPAAGQFTGASTNISPSLATLFAYPTALTGLDAGAGKYFFSNETMMSKKGFEPVPPASAAIMTAVDGTPDVFGKAYSLPAGSKGADPLGDSRPFQTEPKVDYYSDPDFFGQPSDNKSYLVGPVQNLIKSPSFPSGHTTYDYTESLLFAVMVPERFSQMIARAAEYGNSRIIVGAHYAMDVIGGRTLAIYDVARLLADDPDYVTKKEAKVPPIMDFGGALTAATTDLRAALEKACGGKIEACAMQDTGRFSNPAANEAFYESTQTYGMPVVYASNDGKTEDVWKLAPEAGYILTAAFPKLTIRQADKILTETEGPGGGFLDNGSSFGVYSRLDLYKAGIEAQAYK